MLQELCEMWVLGGLRGEDYFRGAGGGSGEGMSEGVKGSEEQDDGFRFCDACSMICVFVCCCLMM